MANDLEEGDKGRHPDELKIDMENRDPNELNIHIQVMFQDIIGEPEGVHSADCVWTNAFKCYSTGWNCCYACLTYVCSIPLAFCWGCYFACMTFNHIWYFTPCLRSFNMSFSCLSRLYATMLHCCCDPCYESMSLIFTRIFVGSFTASAPYEYKSMEDYNLMKKKENPQMIDT